MGQTPKLIHSRYAPGWVKKGLKKNFDGGCKIDFGEKIFFSPKVYTAVFLIKFTQQYLNSAIIYAQFTNNNTKMIFSYDS